MSNRQPQLEMFLSDFYSTKFTTVITTLFVAMYGSLAYPSNKLPNTIKNAFKNPYFRILVLAFIMYQGNRDTSLSLALALGFTLVMNHLNKIELDEIQNNASKQIKKPKNRTR
jgi:hypothetical protein